VSDIKVVYWNVLNETNQRFRTVRESRRFSVAFTKDQWTRPLRQEDGSIKRVRNDRWGRGKRWLAVWLDPDGREKSQACATKSEADRHGAAMETDRNRGDYIDPSAGKVRFDEIGQRWLSSRLVDPSTTIQYESKWRLHVEPAFGRRQVKSIRPSEIAAWLAKIDSSFGPSTARSALLVLQGALDQAVADETIKRNPAKSKVVKRPSTAQSAVTAWADETVAKLIDAHPAMFEAIPVIGAGCGLRQGEIFGLALEDFDFDEQVIRVRRQIKKLGKESVFALPKNDQERTVPMANGVAQIVSKHVAMYKPEPYSLPWEKLDGRPLTVNLLFRWTDDKHIRARGYDELIWKPALAEASVIPAPEKDRRDRRKYITDRKSGMHALRHYYASVTLADGVNIKELAEYLGHHDPGFTLRLYTHMLPMSHERARSAIDARLFRPRLLAV
jgi:integrase